MESFSNAGGGVIMASLIKTIAENKQYLSDIDGAIGDGDHGINMNKGFSLCAEALKKQTGDLAYGLATLSRILMTGIGGSMGPLYGMFFRSMAKSCEGKPVIDAKVFGEMLKSAETGISAVSTAKAGDKTLLDTLVPAAAAYAAAVESGESFRKALDRMKAAAIKGRDSTRDMLAKAGRSSRLGERSRGVLDAGATSCCLILTAMADSINTLLEK